MEKQVTFMAELTDTFAGEANYSYVIRKTFKAPLSASDAMLVRRAKKALGYTNYPCRKESLGDVIALYPANKCIVIFIDVIEV